MNVGDHVFCVDDSPCGCGCGDDVGVTKGVSYVVSSHFVCPVDKKEKVSLVGQDLSTPHHPEGVGTGAHRFRLLSDMKKEAALKARISNAIKKIAEEIKEPGWDKE